MNRCSCIQLNEIVINMTLNIKKIKTEVKKVERMKECAQHLGAMSDITRLKICWILSNYKGISVNEIAEILGISPSAVSHSIAKLEDCGLVDCEKRGRNVYYHLTHSPINRFVKRFVSAKI